MAGDFRWLTVCLTLSVLVMATGCGESKRTTHARCAAEGQAAVEAFLRTDAAAIFTNKFGSFVSMEGSDYSYPVWNIQGHLYLTLTRQAIFKRGGKPIVIYVTEGRVTAPGLTNVGQPRIEGRLDPFQGTRIFVSHPLLKP